VAKGKLVRSDEQRNGQYVYRASEFEKIYQKLSPEEKAQVQAEGKAHEDAVKLLAQRLKGCTQFGFGTERYVVSLVSGESRLKYESDAEPVSLTFSLPSVTRSN
jgi:hypothetical protein